MKTSTKVLHDGDPVSPDTWHNSDWKPGERDVLQVNSNSGSVNWRRNNAGEIEYSVAAPASLVIARTTRVPGGA